MYEINSVVRICISVEHRKDYYIGIQLIKKDAPLQNNGETDMLRLLRKKPQGVKNWHSKAMLIDPRKTKITIINIETIDWEEQLDTKF